MLTEKQIAWNATKAANRRRVKSTVHRLPGPLALPYMATKSGIPPRAVAIAPSNPRPRRVTGQCPGCVHGWKHHTEAGRCRKGCACRNGADR